MIFGRLPPLAEFVLATSFLPRAEKEEERQRERKRDRDKRDLERQRKEEGREGNKIIRGRE